MYWKLRRPALTDGVIDLYAVSLYPPDEEMGFGQVLDFIIAPHGVRREAGRLSLRMGESECVYYFGHIGYHVDPPYRGHHYAARSCALTLPLFRRCGKETVVITCDPDNLPSRKTCERLNCKLESIVPVPKRLQQRWELSPVKCRYILKTDPTPLSLDFS